MRNELQFAEDVTDDDEVRGYGDGIHTQRCQLFAETKPEEEVQQHDVQTVIKQMGTAEADAVLGGGLLLESPVGTEPVVHQKTEHVTDGIGNVHVDPVLQDPIYDVVDGG